MDILYLLIPLSLVLVLLIGVVFWYALRGGQFDDLDGPAVSVIADDDRPRSGGAAGTSDHK
jgi:cbb3-type cytochrome oxidase maturation protein